MDTKRIGKLLVKTIFTLSVIGALGLPFVTGHLKDPINPLSHKEIEKPNALFTEAFEFSETTEFPPPDILDSIPQFVQTPKGGTPWDVFGETKEHEYTYQEDDEYEYVGVKPEFTEKLQKLDGKIIIIQGYMFPLSQDEKQPTFLLGPFPLSCPYHYHMPPRLLLEVHAAIPVQFSYDAVDIQGKLELVPNDDEYNVFYRLKDAKVLEN